MQTKRIACFSSREMFFFLHLVMCGYLELTDERVPNPWEIYYISTMCPCYPATCTLHAGLDRKRQDMKKKNEKKNTKRIKSDRSKQTPNTICTPTAPAP